MESASLAEAVLVPESRSSTSASPSLSLGSLAGAGGSPRRSLLWDYSHTEATASAGAGSATICGHSIIGKYTTNLKGDLKSSDSRCYKRVLEEEETKTQAARKRVGRSKKC